MIDVFSQHIELNSKFYLISTMTEGVWAMAPTRLQTHITHRKIRNISWQPGNGHFPGVAVPGPFLEDIQVQPVRFCKDGGKKKKKKNL